MQVLIITLNITDTDSMPGVNIRVGKYSDEKSKYSEEKTATLSTLSSVSSVSSEQESASSKSRIPRPMTTPANPGRHLAARLQVFGLLSHERRNSGEGEPEHAPATPPIDKVLHSLSAKFHKV